ncbi:lachesin-like isoform X2 [Lingula anatina]|uniref:Lachesin-like isoform X1 n=1 Tax=Lingula anatina TaxID=7574 RepID=A0A1S3HUJ1_LINAN|nr:lachesin-like isoform X1 [Lingula anatina]XP_013389211.1 lachesin-like isoform X2 [Lingula anatina]|eukprot:XP_013389210.1 lachesin-like isoform X1 [Lingula anatina]
MASDIVGIVFLAYLATVSAQTDPKVYLNFMEPFNRPETLITHVPVVSLNCTVEDMPKQSSVSYEKIQNGTKVPISFDTTVYDKTKYQIEKKEPSTWILDVRNIKETDEGDYRCYIYVTQKTQIFASKRMIVYDAPKILKMQTTQVAQVDEDKHTSLLCKASGSPAPEIKWERVGGGMMPGGGEEYIGEKLDIRSAKAEDMGLFRCEATNRVGVATTEVQLIVDFTPVLSSPYLNRENEHVALQKKGHKISILCFILANPNVESGDVVWSFSKLKDSGSQDLTSGDYRFLQRANSEATAKYVINSVSADDYGYYTCSVSNNKGSSSLTIKLEETNTAQPDQIAGAVSGATTLSGFVSVLLLLLFWSLS